MSPNSNSPNVVAKNGYGKASEDRKSLQLKKLHEKEFKIRDSLLTQLFENVPHIATVQNIFIATMMCLFTSIILNDYIKSQEITLGIYLITYAFGKLHIAGIIWICYFLVSLLMFHFFSLWGTIRLKYITNKKFTKIWDASWIGFLAIFYVFAFRTSSNLTMILDLPYASTAIVLLEQTRFTMKIHAFVRSNAEKIVKYKPHSDQDLNWPKFSHYVYFLFAPTMVYRDEYPRTAKINWDFALMRFVEIIGVIFYQSFIFHRFILPSYRDFGIRKYTWTEVLAPLLAENSVPGLLVLLSGFYQILHSVQNLFAEILRFGDRQFYTDWWNSTSMADYFRTWNIVIHDWLHAYIYRDIYYLTNSKTAGKLVAFVASLVVHEWVLTYLFKFFYPVLMYFFASGAVISAVKPPKFRFVNVIFWYMLALGSGIICSLYTLEYYARTNQPDSNPDASFRHYFVPRWATCDCIGNSYD